MKDEKEGTRVERLLAQEKGFSLPIQASSFATGSQLKAKLKKLKQEQNCRAEEEVLFLVLCRVIVPAETDSP